MKYAVVLLSLVNGTWMVIDGCYVLINGKYIGPEKPGPWASVLSITGVDVFRLGPVFIVFGLAWMSFALSFWTDAGWSRVFGLILSAVTLWYVPFGTLISIVVLIALIFFQKS